MKKKKIALLFLFFLLLGQFLVSSQVLQNAHIVRYADEAQYLYKGLLFYHVLFTDHDISQSTEVDIPYTLRDVFRIQTNCLDRPPLLFITQACAWYCLSFFDVYSVDVLILILNPFYLLVIVLSCYAIGSLLCDWRVGVLSAILVACMPLLNDYSRVMMTELPLTAMTCLSFFLLFKSKRFTQSYVSVLLGISMALAQLTRETFSFYFIVPFLCYAYESLFSQNRSKVLSNIFICIGAFSIIVAPIYLNPRTFYVFEKYFLFSKIAPHYATDSFYYIKNFPVIVGYMILIPTIPLFLLSVFRFKQVNKVLLLWFFFPLVIHSVVVNKADRFIIPVIPAYCILVSLGLYKSQIRNGLKNIYALFIVVLCTMQYLLIHFVPAVKPFFQNDELCGVRNAFIRHPYYQSYNDLAEIFRRESIGLQEKKSVLILFDVPYISDLLAFKLLSEDIFSLIIFNLIEGDPVDAPQPGTVDWAKSVRDSDYLVDKEGGYEGRLGSRENIREQYKEGLRIYGHLFEVIAEVPVEYDDSHLIVYRKKE